MQRVTLICVCMLLLLGRAWPLALSDEPQNRITTISKTIQALQVELEGLGKRINEIETLLEDDDAIEARWNAMSPMKRSRYDNNIVEFIKSLRDEKKSLMDEKKSLMDKENILLSKLPAAGCVPCLWPCMCLPVDWHQCFRTT